MNKLLIELTDAGKKFNREWIFRHLNHRFESGNCYAITGSNGSGKSTLLQCIASSTNLSEGSIQMSENILGTNTTIIPENIYQQFSICAPYLELVEEMTAQEFLFFHTTFKPLINAFTIEEILTTIGLAKASHKQIRYFSSGMKQRLKLAQAFFAKAPLLLLDEPCTNLDREGIALYHQLIHQIANNKLIIICSNDETEIEFCEQRISIPKYK